MARESCRLYSLCMASWTVWSLYKITTVQGVTQGVRVFWSALPTWGAAFRRSPGGETSARKVRLGLVFLRLAKHYTLLEKKCYQFSSDCNHSSNHYNILGNITTSVHSAQVIPNVHATLTVYHFSVTWTSICLLFWPLRGLHHRTFHASTSCRRFTHVDVKPSVLFGEIPVQCRWKRNILTTDCFAVFQQRRLEDNER